MRCSKCGAEGSPGARYCMKCGEELIKQDGINVSVQPNQQQWVQQNMIGQQNASLQPPQKNVSMQSYQNRQYQLGEPYLGQQINQQWEVSGTEMPMKWYKFVIYGQLFINAFLNILQAVMFFTGMHYNQGMATANLVYGFFPSLRMLDIVFGFMFIALAIYAIVVRQQLAGFKKHAPMMYFVLIGFNMVIGLFYFFAAMVIISSAIGDIGGVSNQMNSVESSVSMLTGGAVLLGTNIVYFKKRKYLFVR